ncbi:MAG: putative bifunctional diguanylate cyclase/phosphodiesterase [Roseburia sp.]
MASNMDFMNVIQSMSDVLVLFWDVHQGWEVVNANSALLSDRESISNAIEELLEYVQEEDKDTYGVFLRKIAGGMKGSEHFVPIQEERLSVSVRMKTQNDMYTYHKIECYLMKNEDRAVIRMNVLVRPLDVEEIYQMHLAQNSTTDRTPAMFFKVVNEIVRKNPEAKYALVQFDVVKFKAINEMYGEAFGDELLNHFIESLKVICSKDQIFVRLTADAFMIMLSYETKQDILDFVETVNSNLLGYKGIVYRLVFGVAFVENFREGLRKFGDRAALARQSIKGNALQYVAFYEDGMKKSVLTGKYIEDHMEQALKNREFVMYLQPKYSMHSGKMVGAEALVRWIQPENGMVPPMEFIPAFEKNGFVTKMDAFIWEEACKVIRSWIDAGMEPLPISVNVSRLHLKDNQFVEVLNHLVDKYQISKEYLEIELTETTDSAKMSEGISLLKDNGYTLLMDDFGSGYSSLNTLKDTQFDVIKIDRGFLQDFIGSERGQKIVEHTIQMTKSIGLDLVAEGVETEEQAQFLMGCGCDTAQGFYYAKPMTVEQFNELMRMQ